MDNIDLDYCKAHNIAVFNTPQGPTLAVAELVLGSILSAYRSISTSNTNTKNERWHKSMGHLLSNKTVGIIGLGRIGLKLCELLQPFSCTLLGVDPLKPNNDVLNSLSINHVTLSECLESADIISLHLPLTPETYHMIKAKEFALMKENALLINMARGGLINESDLHSALQSGKIKGAILDVFEKEPYDGPLNQLENVFLTPHIGSYAIESRIQMEIDAVNNCLKGLGLGV